MTTGTACGDGPGHLANRMHLALQLHADCADEVAANALDARLRLALSPWSPTPARPPARDWKRPQTFTFAYALSPADEAGFRTFVVRSGVRWDLSGDAHTPRAEWWRDREIRFLAPEIFRGALWLVDADAPA